jgi:hypothetical protein
MSDENATASETGLVNREITANVDKLHDIKELKFGFRTQKDADTGVETKRATVEVKLPVLSIEGIIDVLQRGEAKEIELLNQAIENTYTDFIKSKLAEDPTLTSDNFPYAEVTWQAIANQPESERRGRGIQKEVWEDFFKDYIAVMPGLTGKDVKFVEKQAAVLAQKLQQLKSHEDKNQILPKFKDQLTIYLGGSKNAEQFAECVDFLMKKADTLMASETSADLAKNLGF